MNLLKYFLRVLGESGRAVLRISFSDLDVDQRNKVLCEKG